VANNGGAAYGDLGFRHLYVGEFDVQWDNTFGLGLHYMHARHYAPALGRFLQPDPDGLEDAPYAYAANNPVTEMDPDGTCFIVRIAVGAVVDTALYLATTDSKDCDWSDAVSTVAMGAVESAVNPFAKISKAAKLVNAAGTALSKVPKATRAALYALRRASGSACGGTDFRDAELVGCDFAWGIDIGQQLWPAGARYVRLDRWPERVAHARQAFETWPADERREAMIVLEVYSAPGYEYQDEVFVNKYDASTPR